MQQARRCGWWAAALSLVAITLAAEAPSYEFNVPAATAARSLKAFAQQSGIEVLISAELGRQVRTQPVRGRFTPRAALDLMLVGTGLVMNQDPKTGFIVILSAPALPGPGEAAREKKTPMATRTRRPATWPDAPATTGSAASARRQDAAVPPDTEEPVELTPFVVNAAQDRGYQAQSSLAGSRLRTDLKHIATPVSSFTEQFLLDTAITNTDDLARFMLSTEYDFAEEAGNQNSLFGPARPLRVRGLNGGQVTTNFFKTGGRADTFSLERIEQSRGPNAVLFGVGNPGGIINTTTKRARLDGNRGVVSSQLRADGGTRFEGDYNQTLIPGRLAIRVAAVTNRLNSWRNREFNDDDRGFATLRWKLSPTTELNAEIESGQVTKRTNRTFTALDAYTVWAAAGRLVSGVPVPASGIERTAGPGATWLALDTATGTLLDYAAGTRTMARPLVGGDPTMLDFSVLPRETSLLGPGMGQTDGYNRLTAFLEHAFTPNLSFEVAAMRLNDHFASVDASQNISQFLRADPNPLLPTGAPNPNVGRAYLETQTQRGTRDTRIDAVRISGSYKFDLRRLGVHTLAGVAEYNFEKSGAAQRREFVVSANAPNVVNPENNNNRVWRRTYVDLAGPSAGIVLADWRALGSSGLTEAVSGRTYQTDWLSFGAGTQFTATEIHTLIGMLQSSFLGGRLHTVAGASRDERTSFSSTLVRQPLAGFTNGVLTPVRDRDGTGSSADNLAFSGVLQLVPGLGLTYSKARNQGLATLSGSIPSPDGGLPNTRPPRVIGRSEDLGFKLDLFERRLFVTVTYFRTSADHDFDFSPPVTQGSINAIWDALAASGVNDPMTQAPIISPRDVLTGATFSSHTEGYEAELTANPAANWRIFLNYSRSRTIRTNIAPELVNYIARQRDFWTAGDRGQLYLVGRGTGLAPAPRDGNTTIDTITEQLDAIDENLLTNVTYANGRRPLGQIPQKLNFRTAYDLTEGPFKGVGAGLGLRWQDRPVVSFVPATAGSESVVGFGARQTFLDLSLSYQRPLAFFGRSVRWSVQLNVDNVLDNDRLVILRQNATGQTVNYRFNDPRMWILTNRFTF